MFSAVLHEPGNLVISFNHHFRDFGSDSLDTRERSSPFDPRECGLSRFFLVGFSSLCRTLRVGGIHNGNHATHGVRVRHSKANESLSRATYLLTRTGYKVRRDASRLVESRNFHLFYIATKSLHSSATSRPVELSNPSDTKKFNNSVIRVTSRVSVPALLPAREPMLRKSEVEKCSRR